MSIRKLFFIELTQYRLSLVNYTYIYIYNYVYITCGASLVITGLNFLTFYTCGYTHNGTLFNFLMCFLAYQMWNVINYLIARTI